MSDTLVLPRPGASTPNIPPTPIKAPSEAAFTTTFGTVLPKASYLETPHGRAAYYNIPPSSPQPQDHPSPISRVLFVHGVQTCAIGMHPLASALAARFPHAQCVLVDQWGHGLSDTPVAAHEPALFHSLLKDLMAELEWPDAHFVGYSFGGSTTATFAAKYSHLVSSMVLVAPAGLIRSSQFNELQHSYLRGGEGVEDAARAWVLAVLEGGKLVVPADWKERVARGEVVAEAVREWQLREHEGHAASVVGIFRDGGVLDRQAGFVEAVGTGVRGLCVLGELDDVCSVGALDEVGMKNVVVVPGVGHGLVRQRVPEVVAAVEEFWGSL